MEFFFLPHCKTIKQIYTSSWPHLLKQGTVQLKETVVSESYQFQSSLRWLGYFHEDWSVKVEHIKPLNYEKLSVIFEV